MQQRKLGNKWTSKKSICTKKKHVKATNIWVDNEDGWCRIRNYM